MSEDQEREFLDIRFWNAVLDQMVKQDPQLNDPEILKRVEDAFLHLIEHSNAFAAIASAAIGYSANAVNTARFVYLCTKLGFTGHTISTLFKSMAGLHTAGAMKYITNISQKMGDFGKLATKVGKLSAVFLVITSCVQITIHLKRGDHGLALGELVKTVFACLATPFAVMELFDLILCALYPDFMKNPFVRILRLIPGALQGAKQLANSLVTLAHVYFKAESLGLREVNDKLNRLADEWERTQFGVVTELSRGIVYYMATKFPKMMNSEFIRNLVVYHQNHPISW